MSGEERLGVTGQKRQWEWLWVERTEGEMTMVGQERMSMSEGRRKQEEAPTTRKQDSKEPFGI